ncbi:efflux transporter outer membrane subunit [Luteimonas sp. RD2P54]|uniref:Efflux transporter outer membrane subunit n=1 Tax=Luteimonas endophytica TaxID=3042023 RepID=A0ABT6J5N0_9GAMM|nr:efflux transporter outer membrane subunit [Luteimonas endophytica]MDH5821842.1 efflux transporter outer membrane subunit [Luteimonas endophytica]
MHDRYRSAARGLPSLLALALAACAAGPDHVRPELAVAETFAASPAPDPSALPAPDEAFWEAFGDARLDALVAEALQANHDLRIALANYDRANALLRGARFDRFPTVTGSAEAASSRASADQAPGVPRADRDTDGFSAGISASWELDLFGRVRRGVEAARAGAAAGAADLAALQVAIVGEVVRGYVELRGAQERLRVAQANADNQRETLRLVEARFEAGRGTGFDTARARAQLESTLARVPALQAEVATQIHRLSVLTGRTPDALAEVLGPSAPLPALPQRLDAGTPGDLLRRRPDIAAAEQRLHAATARIGVATADLFPRFTLGGLIGSQAIDSSALFERDSETRLVALGIDWSFLDIGRVRARIAAAEAEAAGELARYEQTVLLALEDTENALVRYARNREQDAHLALAAADSARAAELARTRFEAGAADLFEVLDAERTRLQAEDALAEARTRSVTGAVALYRALAGGWPQRLPAREQVAGRG